MSTDVKDLPYAGTGTPQQWERIKQAKANIGLPFMVRPVLDQGTHWRVLAFQEPEDICDYAPVTEKTTVEGYEAALRWLYGAEDPRPTTALQMLQRVFGPEVREIPQEQLNAERMEERRKEARRKIMAPKRGSVKMLEQKELAHKTAENGPRMEGNVNLDELDKSVAAMVRDAKRMRYEEELREQEAWYD